MENIKEKPYIFKRVLAYIIDMMIISLVSTLLLYFVPNKDYENASNNLVDIVEKIKNGEITQEEYNEISNDAIYELNKTSVDTTLIMGALTISYYVIFAYTQNGQTLGKKLMKLRIVSSNNKKLHINNYLIRTVIITSVLIDVISCIMIMTLSKSNYLEGYNVLSNIYSILTLVTLGFMFYRNDGRGLHDILAGTKVINDINVNAQEAVVIKEEAKEVVSNTLEIDTKEEEIKEEKKKGKKKSKKVNEPVEGVSQSERV